MSPPVMGLTPRMAAALAAIRDLTAEHGCSPSYAEIGAALGVSKSAAHRLVRGLQERGAPVLSAPHRQRTVRIG